MSPSLLSIVLPPSPRSFLSSKEDQESFQIPSWLLVSVTCSYPDSVGLFCCLMSPTEHPLRTSSSGRRFWRQLRHSNILTLKLGHRPRSSVSGVRSERWLSPLTLQAEISAWPLNSSHLRTVSHLGPSLRRKMTKAGTKARNGYAVAPRWNSHPPLSPWSLTTHKACAGRGSG